jgi:MFS family permease
MQIAARLRGQRVYRGWWIVSALFLASALVVGSSQYAFGLFVGPLEQTFGWTRTQINVSLSFTAVGSLAAPLLGRIMDRHGARPIMAVSLALIGISYLLRPLMTELWHWYGLSFLQYIGYAGASILPAGRLVGIWFRKTRGRVMGFTAMGNNFGGLVVPPIVGAVLSMASWQGAYLALAAITAVIVLYALVIVREFPSAEDTANEGASLSKGKQGDTQPVLTGWTVKEALHSKAFYFITATVLLGTFTYSTILPQVTAHLTNEGISVTAAASALSLLAIFGMGGKLVFGYMAEKITARYALMIDLLGQAAFVLLMLLVGSYPVLTWVAVPLFGFFMGAFGAMFQLIVQETFGVRYFGSIMGIVNMATVVSFGVGPILAGLSFDITGSYRIAFITIAVLFAAGSLLLTQARVARPDPA